MVTPFAIDNEIVTGIALNAKAERAQKLTTAVIGRLVIGHDAVQIKCRKTIGDN